MSEAMWRRIAPATKETGAELMSEPWRSNTAPTNYYRANSICVIGD